MRSRSLTTVSPIELFCVDPAAEEANRLHQKSQDKAATKPVVRILDLRRVNNVGIGLSRFYKRLSHSEVVKAIIERQMSILSLDDLLTLKPLIPTAEERQNLLLYSGPMEELGPAERFMVEAAREPHLEWMVHALIYERQFDGEVETITGKLTLVIGMLTKIRESPALKTLLRLVLELGNLANYDYGHMAAHVRVRGKALGFKMESLMKLQDVKSVDRKTNLLQYLVMTVEERHPEVFNLPVDFADLSVVRHWETATLLTQIEELIASYKRIKDLNLSLKEPTMVEQFRAGQAVFLNRAAALLERLGSIAALLRGAWQRTAEYLGEESNDRRPEELFHILDTFFRMFSDAIKKVQGDAKRPGDEFRGVRASPPPEIDTFRRPHPPPQTPDDASSSLSSEFSTLVRSDSLLSIRPATDRPQ